MRRKWGQSFPQSELTQSTSIRARRVHSDRPLPPRAGHVTNLWDIIRLVFTSSCHGYHSCQNGQTLVYYRTLAETVKSWPQIWCLQLEVQQKRGCICSTVTIMRVHLQSAAHSAAVIKTLLITVGLGWGAGRKTSVRPAPLDPRDPPEDYQGQLAHCGPTDHWTLPLQRAHDTFVQPLFNNYLLCAGRREWGQCTYITDKTRARTSN